LLLLCLIPENTSGKFVYELLIWIVLPGEFKKARKILSMYFFRISLVMLPAELAKVRTRANLFD